MVYGETECVLVAYDGVVVVVVDEGAYAWGVPGEVSGFCEWRLSLPFDRPSNIGPLLAQYYYLATSQNEVNLRPIAY